jgi:hypothetical protein
MMLRLDVSYPHGVNCPSVKAETDEPRTAIGIDDIEQIDYCGTHFLLDGNDVIGMAGHGEWHLLMIFVNRDDNPLVEHLRGLV